MSDSAIAGYDVGAVEAWIEANVDDVVPPCTWTKLEGGHSNLTYRLTDHRGRDLVVRRPPLGELLPKAHDMGREFRVIRALGPTAVPVATAYAHCTDPAVTGAEFYVMSLVPGRAMYGAEMVEEYLDLEARARVGPSFVDVQAALHSIEPADVGLGELGRHDGYIQRQLRTWYGSWTASAEAADFDDERIHELHELLLARVPDQGPARVVHGDYGLHNCMLSPEGTLTAVLDWEIATLGDPMADFAYALNAWVEPEDDRVAVTSAPTSAPGFATRTELVDRYAATTGRDLEHLGYHRAFNYFKTACIVHGVFARYRMGQKSTEGVNLDGLKRAFEAAIDLAADHAAGL